MTRPTLSTLLRLTAGFASLALLLACVCTILGAIGS